MQRNDIHLAFLDRLRGIAILGVFLFHCHGAVYGWSTDLSHATTLSSLLLLPLNIGGAGVSIFFVVSGFCIHLSYQRSEKKDLSTFFTRRFFRIYPPYFVALCIFSFLYPWHVIHFGSAFAFVQFFSHLFLIHNLSDRTFFGINGAFWSIAVEIQLYLLYPLLLFFARSFSWTRALWITGSLEVGIRAYTGIYTTIYHAQPMELITGSPFGFWFSWSIGAAAAEAFLKGKDLPFCKIPIWVFPSLTLGSGLIQPLAPFGFLLAALSTVSFINLSLRTSKTSQPTRFPLAERHLRFVGIVSYSVYLLHQPVVHAIAERLTRTRFQPHPLSIFLLTSATLIPILFLSWCFYRLFELPSIELGKMIIQNCFGNCKPRPWLPLKWIRPQSGGVHRL